ncbi:MAG: retroviral-like aspartic protease family protein [Proteobacteria bacterium]|jgi:aspartyl protease family protein|nr:retroviral-like aspartic protease family protein [Pseudomonadota bacterium]
MSERQQRKFGRNMFWLMWLVLLGLLTLFFSKVLDRQYNPNQNLAQHMVGKAQEVVLVRNKYGHYVASGLINQQPVVFMLDTGASDISIPQSTAQRLGLKRGRPVVYQTANGQVINYATRLGSVTLGNLTLQDVSASINPNMSGDDVLLGMSFLKHVEFSQKGNTLTLRR